MMHTRKVELRRQQRRVRDAIPAETRAANAQAMAAHFSLDAGEGAIAGYAPVTSEADPRPLMHRLAAEGRALALPIISDGGFLTFKSWQPDDTLAPGPMGIMQPTTGPDIIPALVIVPLLAFDAFGYRLGYGGGYYDRTLAQILKTTPIVAIGIAFDEQEVSKVPVERHDVPMSHILTQSGLRSFPAHR